MKKFTYLFATLISALSFSSFTDFNPDPPATVQWMTWEEAVEANEKEPRKILVDVYTDWCGWCKVMDKKTFTDSEVVAMLNKDFYAVKLDAEQKEIIRYNDNDFNFVQTKGSKRGGVHMLAYSLLEGKMSYPTIVYLNEKFERISISPGYKEVQQLKDELEFASGEHYINGTFNEFLKKRNKP